MSIINGKTDSMQHNLARVNDRKIFAKLQMNHINNEIIALPRMIP